MYGHSDDMRLLLLNDRTGMKKLDEERARFLEPGKAPMFFTLNDDGWTLCSIGKKALDMYSEVLPKPSRWEKVQSGDIASILMNEMVDLHQCRGIKEKRWKNLT